MNLKNALHNRLVSRGVLLGVGCALLLCSAGCPDEQEKSRVMEVVGTIESIDMANNKVKVRAYLEKHETYQTFDVQVTDDTEILINGALGTMADARVGERAEGRIRATRNDGKTVLTALSVSIERGEVLSAPETTGDEMSAGTADADKDTEDAKP
ncbi:MAG: hypothetical protein H6817_02160 [Phycisphaerales bacterium]|nr:hypothetical protein [Phycisphaerales bacterium]